MVGIRSHSFYLGLLKNYKKYLNCLTYAKKKDPLLNLTQGKCHLDFWSIWEHEKEQTSRKLKSLHLVLGELNLVS